MTTLGTIAALVTAFSLNATNYLTQLPEDAGVAATYSITGATATTPVVVTLGQPHNFTTPYLPDTPAAHVAIEGVTGIASADGVFVALVVDATHLQLFTMNYATGALVPVVGSGAYTGGGTLMTAFNEGRILLGVQHVNENSAPPRCVFVPKVSSFGPRRATSAMPPTAVGYKDAALVRPLWNESLHFDVHVWGAASPPSPELGDFDATRLLYTTIIQSIHLIAVGSYSLTNTPWTDQKDVATRVDKLGTQVVLGLTIEIPVLDNSLMFVPPGTQGQVTLNFSGAPSGDAITFEAGSA